MLLCDEVAPVIRVLVLNTRSNEVAPVIRILVLSTKSNEVAPVIRVLLTQGPMHVLGKRKVDCFAFKYYSNLRNLQNLYRSKHMYEPAHPGADWRNFLARAQCD